MVNIVCKVDGCSVLIDDGGDGTDADISTIKIESADEYRVLIDIGKLCLDVDGEDLIKAIQKVLL